MNAPKYFSTSSFIENINWSSFFFFTKKGENINTMSDRAPMMNVS